MRRGTAVRLRVATILPAVLLASAVGLGQPKFVLEGGKAFDFGELRTIVTVTRELHITNEGTDTLRITDVSGSCGCTGTLLSNNEIAPGGEAVLKITFDPAKFKGKVDKVVSMKTNDPADPNPHITFTATINQVLEFDVTHVVVMTPVDSEATVAVEVTNRTDAPLRITSVKADPPGLTFEVTPETLEPGGSGEMLCRTRPGKAGITKGDITVSTDNPLLPTVGLRYLVYAKGPAGQPAPGK